MQQAARNAIAAEDHGKIAVSLADTLKATVEAVTESTTDDRAMKAHVAELDDERACRRAPIVAALNASIRGSD